MSTSASSSAPCSSPTWQDRLRDDPNQDFIPRTFIFGAKAAASYRTAKRIIELICSLSAT